MKSPMRLIPNQITLVRVLLVPVLWILALLQLKTTFAIIITIAGFTDALDGFAARRLKQISTFGIWFDSFADNILIISSPFWLWMLLPEFILNHWISILIVVGLFVLSLIMGFAKYGQMVQYHMMSSKVMAMLLYFFVVHALFFQPSEALFYIAASAASLSFIEEMLVTLTHKKMQKNRLSFFSKT